MPPRRRSTPEVEATRHQDKRSNIPTTELGAFVAEAESAPPHLLYPRDPSLDPQLVWRGKDDQDRAELDVPVVPIYVQEKIEPRALVEDLRRRSASAQAVQELQLFADFDGGLSFEEKIDFYHHEANWSNRLIVGDSLLVMASLAEKEGLRGKVQTIYLDPPYGIRFGSNWQVSTRKRNVQDGRDADVTRQPEQVKAFRDTWELGIHSYLSYLRDRLVAARDLLTDSGSVFVQIGDENQHLVRGVLDEVFGSQNFVSNIVLKTTSGAGSPSGGTLTLAHVHDYLVWYAKDKDHVKYRQLFLDKARGVGGADLYRRVRLPDSSDRPATPQELEDPSVLPPGCRLFRPDNLTSQSSPEGSQFPVEMEGRSVRPGKGGWKTNREGMERLRLADRLFLTSNGTLQYVRYLDDFPASPLSNVWTDVGTGSFTDPKVYVVQTNVKIIERCILMTTDPGDLVLDPTCGSGTTPYVSEQWGRRWIAVDTSRVALALARTRLMAARFPSYALADPERADVRKGFVYRSVPHVQLKSIAQNPEILTGMSRAEIDEAVRRRAESELLYDQAQVEPGRVRVTGRFTVESLSPHRVLESDEGTFAGASNDTTAADGDYTRTILDNLRAAGVQNTVKQERLRFDRLEPWPGEWVNAVGEYTDSSNESRRVAVAIGPEHGTVGPVMVREAAKETMRGAGFDVLIVCGFAFDAAVGETAKEFGRLTVLPAKMNPDLAMGAGLLKKTGAGNLFTVFGQPDLLVTHASGDITVELRGVDIYDPTTGEVRSSSTDDIACWFIDTDYDQESFFVRHAYFTGDGDPYERLRRALRVEIDEETWLSIYSTVSRPFPAPSTGRIAVKVINHYGDEIMRVYEVSQ